MHRIRTLGNDYLHPDAAPAENTGPYMRARHAAETITLLVEILKHLYLASGET